MENISWKKVCVSDEKNIQETAILLERINDSNKNILILLQSNDINDIINGIELLSDSSYELNSYHKLCFLMKHVSPDEQNRNIWIKLDNLIKIHIDKNKYDIHLYTSLVNIINNNKKINLDEHEKKFILYIIKEYEKRGFIITSDYKCNKLSSTYDKISVNENKMKNILSNTNTKLISHVIDSKTVLIPQKIDCLFNILKSRNNYANMMEKSDYFNLVADINVDSLKITIKKILDNFNSINTLTSDKIKYTFQLDHSIQTMLDIIHDMFKLNFSINDTIETWEPSVKVFDVIYKNNLVGYLYIDLQKRQGKFDEPIAITLYDAIMFPIKSEVIKVPVCVIVGNYKNNISFNDMIKIFRQFGNVVHSFFHKSKYGSINISDTVGTFMENLFENIALDNKNIVKFLSDKTLDDINQNKIHVNNMISVKYLCTLSLFDYMCHSTYFQNIINPLELINKYNDIMISSFNKNKTCNNIPDDVINLVCFKGGLTYTLLINKLLSFNVYSLLNKSNIDRFIYDVLSETLTPMNDSINTFIKNCDKPEESKSLEHIISRDNNIIKKIKSNTNNININTKSVASNSNYFTDN